MSHSFRVSDETYRALREVAAKQGQSPESLFAAWVAEQQAKDGHAEHRAEGRAVGDAPDDDPLGPFLGAFEATEPDVVRRHDDYLAEANGGPNRARS